MAETNAERERALQIAISQIEKQFGKGAIMRLGERGKTNDIPVIPTGALTLDLALGIGGIPVGRVTEIYGPESSGKTTLTLSIIAECQKRGGICAFIDAEHALDPFYAKSLGVDIDNLYISQPDTGEQALEIVESLIRSNAIDLIVVDSVAALVPRAEIDGDMGDAVMGMQARLMSQALRKLTAILNKTKTALIFINQIRMKIGTYGNPETTTGGLALKFYSSIRMEIRKKDTLKKGEENYGNRIKVKVVKNKLAAPFRSAEFDIIFGKGISKAGCLVDAGLACGVIERHGTWYSVNGERVAQGRENLISLVESKPEIFQKIEESVRKHLAESPQIDFGSDDEEENTEA
ncbi:recombinase RecA [Thermospira aquatica]|uniref:Protein RecA n=1 Tax=Thermospira aquatica TaxID=2828656 RepID=A0AAX3BG94_9SPIR|nr:recombinase RecA [Thermospira aquatica]URA11306.1 recombinase RecA [Thermospira aquatica]